MNQRLFFKYQQTKLLWFISDCIKPRKILVIHGKKSYEATGARLFVESSFSKHELEFFSDFETNPKWEDFQSGMQKIKAYRPDMIIAVGGGSVIDMAKLLCLLDEWVSFTDVFSQTNSFDLKRKIPVLAIPTTAGSGAETTQFAVIYHKQQKHSIDHPKLLPDIVYLNHDFLKSQSKYNIAVSGTDALCQALESLWSVNSNIISEKYAFEAFKLSYQALSNTLKNQTLDFEKMQWAAHLAGKSINITRTTAPHALSYAFTTFYGIPHGHAVALTFPFFFKYNYFVTDEDCNNPKGSKYVKMQIEKVLSFLNCSIDDSETLLQSFFKSIGLEMDIQKLIPNFDSSLIIQNINFQRLNNNPRKLNKDEVLNYLTKPH